MGDVRHSSRMPGRAGCRGCKTGCCARAHGVEPARLQMAAVADSTVLKGAIANCIKPPYLGAKPARWRVALWHDTRPCRVWPDTRGAQLYCDDWTFHILVAFSVFYLPRPALPIRQLEARTAFSAPSVRNDVLLLGTGLSCVFQIYAWGSCD